LSLENPTEFVRKLPTNVTNALQTTRFVCGKVFEERNSLNELNRIGNQKKIKKIVLPSKNYLVRGTNFKQIIKSFSIDKYDLDVLRDDMLYTFNETLVHSFYSPFKQISCLKKLF
jgi:hypothetical protein